LDWSSKCDVHNMHTY
jgi:hypothetical protein